MKYFIVAFFVFLLNGCFDFVDLGCEYDEVRSKDRRKNKYISDNNNEELVDRIIENGKHFTIVNHTNKTYVKILYFLLIQNFTKNKTHGNSNIM